MTNLFTIREVAEKLKVSRQTIYRMIDSGELKVFHISVRGPRIREEDLQSYITKRMEGVK